MKKISFIIGTMCLLLTCINYIDSLNKNIVIDNDDSKTKTSVLSMKKNSYYSNIEELTSKNESVLNLSHSKITMMSLSTGYVYTPKGSPVEVLIRDEYSSSFIDKCNSAGDSMVPNATRLASSTAKYNCHSYAWYSQSTNNPYWMNDPSKYYTDGSYYETTSPKIGDIICYFDNDGTVNDKSDDENIHSGIITGLSGQASNGICGDANRFIINSKWGALGLYSHNGVDCPYTSLYGGDADYVKYFRKSEHTHNYTLWKYYNRTSHIEACSCGAIGSKTSAHVVNSSDIVNNRANCLDCGYLLDLKYDMAITFKSNMRSINGSIILSNGIVILVENDIESYYDGTLNFFSS